MEFAAVYHKTSQQMCYPLDEDRLVINIKTGYDVERIFIHYGDPFEAGIAGGKEKWTGKREEIKNIFHIKYGGQQQFFCFIKDVNIILRFIQRMRFGIILKTVF